MSTTNRERNPLVNQMARQGLEAFYHCATFLAFSIEIAAIVALVKVDFGVSTYGMGDDTVRITYAVAMIVLLPLVYALPALRMRAVENANTAGDSGDSDHVRETSSSMFFLFMLCWLLALHPFWSALNVAFGPSKINNSEKAAQTPHELGVIQRICSRDLYSVSSSDDALMTTVIILAYIPVSASIVVTIVWLGVEKNHAGSPLHRRLQRLQTRLSDKLRI
ncbi:hypothetical protein LTR37_021484 [Vermiconidia calcicola]|uniref:Uncharacterized protein n=1 Tax=Vermiconidia calcicola TaxID=1690605 RepID=A0ACC3M8K8_9PEZI|nr:hypothetical protein LTR37_021484 [Vermiconidia calcicola]